jgi:hypothetical protein
VWCAVDREGVEFTVRVAIWVGLWDLWKGVVTLSAMNRTLLLMFMITPGISCEVLESLALSRGSSSMTLADLLVLLVERDGDSRRRETIWLKEDSISDTTSLFPSIISFIFYLNIFLPLLLTYEPNSY